MNGSLGPFASKAKHVGAVLGGVALLSMSGRARADEMRGLHWDAPPPCPTESAVRSAIEQWLTAPESELDLRSIHVEARVRPDPGGFRLEMWFESKGGSGRETLVAAKCETLADIVALKVALAADPVAALETAEGPKKAPHRSPTKGNESMYGLRLEGGAGFGPLPSGSPALGVAGSVGFHHARIELGGAYLFSQSAAYESQPTVGANFTLLAATVRGCATPALGDVEFPVCIGLEAGDVRGAGFGVATSETADRVWVALTLGPAIAVPLTKALFFWLEGDAALGFVRPSGYVIRNLETLFAPGVEAARIWAGLEVRF